MYKATAEGGVGKGIANDYKMFKLFYEYIVLGIFFLLFTNNKIKRKHSKTANEGHYCKG